MKQTLNSNWINFGIESVQLPKEKISLGNENKKKKKNCDICVLESSSMKIVERKTKAKIVKHLNLLQCAI